MTSFEPLTGIPLTYVYVAQIQGASQAIKRAIDASTDQRGDHHEVAEALNLARRHIENIWKLTDDGVRA